MLFPAIGEGAEAQWRHKSNNLLDCNWVREALATGKCHLLGLTGLHSRMGLSNLRILEILWGEFPGGSLAEPNFVRDLRCLARVNERLLGRRWGSSSDNLRREEECVLGWRAAIIYKTILNVNDNIVLHIA